MTSYSVSTGTATFANVSNGGIGLMGPGVMTYVVTTTLAAADTVVFNYPKMNGVTINGVIPFCDSTYNLVAVAASGSVYDTVTVTVGTEVAVGKTVGAMALYGI